MVSLFRNFIFAVILLFGAGVMARAEESTGIQFIPVEEYAVNPQTQADVQLRVDADGRRLFTLRSTGSEEMITVNLGWIPVEPDTSYRARYWVTQGEQDQALEKSADVDLILRQHSVEGGHPLEGLHRMSVKQRPFRSDTAQQWVERAVSVTTLPETRFLSVVIVIGKLEGTLELTGMELYDAQKLASCRRAELAADSRQFLDEIRAQAASRKPLVPRTLVFSRSQMKYGLERNYYHTWSDRPLFVSREYRTPGKYLTPLGSYKRMLQEVVKYDIDGLAFFPETKDRMAMFEATDEAAVDGIGLLPEFLARLSEESIEMKAEIIEKALKNGRTARINGKVLITSYNAGSASPQEWSKALSALHQRFGDTFLFLPALVNGASMRKFYTAGEPIPRELIEKERAVLRSYLDVSDGIYFNYPPAFRNQDRTFDAAFYRDIFIPVFKSVLNEPAYRHKYLGLSAYRSHLNPDRGNSLVEDYTRTLRASFEAAMEAKPDVLILPEWDEVNENTSWRPTIYGGTTSQRIVRYYMSRIRQKEPTPRPGDDETIPNLILSTRKIMTLGDKLVVELLNVPDSVESYRYSAEVSLLDEKGRLAHTFAPVEFDSAKLQEHRLHLPSEKLAQARVLVPTLKLRGYKGKNADYERGFHPIQLRATWNWDDLAVRQPLRDLLQPGHVSLSWKEEGRESGSLVLSGSVASPEELALVEILADDDEVYAVDPSDEFFRNDPEREILLVEYKSINHQEIEGVVTLKNAIAKWSLNGAPLHQGKTAADMEDNRLTLKSPVSLHHRWIAIALPKSAIGHAELDFDFDKAKFSVPVREVFEKKMMVRDFKNGLQFTMAPYRKQIDMPRHLDKKEASLEVRVWPEIATEIYYMRLTSKSGKIFRSRPLLVPKGSDLPEKTLRIYSDTQRRGIDVQVAGDRIPDLKYDFTPERGAMLFTQAGRPFWATLGGFVNTTTGRGNTASLFPDYPKPVAHSAPEWVTGEGRPFLRFRGAGNFLALPREAIPRNGSFTIEFEVQPSDTVNQTLLECRIATRTTGLALKLRGGKLYALFHGEFPTNLAVPAGDWSTVRVSYNFEELTLSVNGSKETFPVALPARNIGYGMIGGGWKGDWFEGNLRSLRILHHAE